MLYGSIVIKYEADGSLRLDASHCTADRGAAEIKEALESLARELGGEWKEERHLIGAKMHHTHDAGNDHHMHH